MTLINRIRNLSYLNSTNPVYIREALFCEGITPSLGQVRQAIKKLQAAEEPSDFNCPICPEGQATEATHDEAYHQALQSQLQEFAATVRDVQITTCFDCGNQYFPSTETDVGLCTICENQSRLIGQLLNEIALRQNAQAQLTN